ncbi:MAG: hypothetical protein JXA93_23075 [Anaerolineae bacterium]|nr:hypothetical protein [Anaerolineae bacterium]
MDGTAWAGEPRTYDHGVRVANRFRWMLLAALLVFNNSGLAPDLNLVGTLGRGGANLLLILGVVLAAWVSYRLEQERAIDLGEVLAISAIQDLLITAGVGLAGGYESHLFILYYPSLAVLGLALPLPTSVAYASAVGVVYAGLGLILVDGATVAGMGAVIFKLVAERWLALYVVLGLSAWAMRHERTARCRVEAKVIGLQQTNDELRATLDRVAEVWQLTASAIDPSRLARHLEAAAAELSDDCRQIEAAAAELGGRAMTASHRGGVATRASGQVAGTARELASRAWPTTAAIEQADAARGRARAVVEEWSSRSQTVGGLSATVRKVADQTNLLAFNANIEAIQAGERGRRFAIVADEVRLVADQAIDMARGIDALSAEMWEGTQQVLDAIDEIGELLDHASALAELALRVGEQQQVDAAMLVQAAEIAAAAADENSASAQAITGVVTEQRATITRLQDAACRLDGWATVLYENKSAIDGILSQRTGQAPSLRSGQADGGRGFAENPDF